MSLLPLPKVFFYILLYSNFRTLTKCLEKKTWWEVCQDTACCFEQIWDATPNKIVHVQPLTSHLMNLGWLESGLIHIYWMNIWVNRCHLCRCVGEGHPGTTDRHHWCKCVGQVILVAQINTTDANVLGRSSWQQR